MNNNSVHYQGQLKDYQLYGANYNNNTGCFQLNEYQVMLYKRAIFGLNIYTEKELKRMHWSKKRRIKSTHKKAQVSINLYKQEIVNTLCDNLFECFFKKSTTEAAERMFSSEKVKPLTHHMNDMTLKDLGLTRDLLIIRLISVKILPQNYFKLTA